MVFFVWFAPIRLSLVGRTNFTREEDKMSFVGSVHRKTTFLYETISISSTGIHYGLTIAHWSGYDRE